MTRSADMNTFSVGELARRTAVTVRTLHHYENLGLLVPSQRTDSGHRRYDARDVVRLRRIVTLRNLGVPLREVGELLDAAPGDLLEALRSQRELLRERRDALDASIRRIDALEQRLHSGDGTLSRGDLEVLMETIAMENQMNWGRRYLTEVQGLSADEAEAKMSETPPDALEGTRKWAALISDVESANATGVQPQSPQGRELLHRWRELITSFTGGDPDKLAQIRQFYADLPAGFPKPYGDDVARFIADAAAPESCV